MGFAVIVRLEASCHRREWARLRDANATIHLTNRPPEEDDGAIVSFTEATKERYVVYRLHCSDLLPSVHSVAEFVQLCGYALNLDHRTMYRLRLYVYELATNSVEHAKYPNGIAMARVEIAVRPRTLRVIYEDNAESFDPSNGPEINVTEKLDNHDKRGFGLHLLRRAARTMKFSRKNGWNRTTFTIDRHAPKAPQTIGGK
jgi:anti-sigma regulatory factor (Ser/Thr protein kinase)